MRTTETEVLVVGAGPTGLTLGCELRRREIRCRVVDEAAQFHRRSRGKGLQPRSLEVFDDLGIAGAALDAGRISSHLRLFVAGDLVADLDLPPRPPRPGVPYPNLLILPQWRTEQVLRDRLTELGGGVELARELTALEQDDDGVTATLVKRGSGAVERVRARFLVGCDGGHSNVREQVGLRLRGTARAQHFVLGDMRIDGLEPGVSHAWFDGRHYLAADPLSGDGTWQVQASVQPDEAGRYEPASVELFQRLFRERGSVAVRLHDATWLSDFSPRVAMVDRYRVGRAFVAGDAAHVHSPAGGQGMNTGIQDAYNLGWKLALVLRDQAPEGLLDSYEQERLPVARSVLRGSDVGHSAVFSSHPVMRVVRERVLAPLLRVGAVQRAILDRAAELDVGYRGSPLSREEVPPLPPVGRRSDDGALGAAAWLRFRRGPHAGDRAPDARGRDAAGGRPARLFDRFRGPQLTLLLFAGTAAPSATAGAALAELIRVVDRLPAGLVRCCLVVPAGTSPDGVDPAAVFLDADGEAHRLYGAQGGAVHLVRPDGYIGYRAPRVDEHAVRGYLRGILAPAPAGSRAGRRVPVGGE